MKIAVWHNLPSGGGKRALYSFVKELSARGHHIECWTPVTSNQAYLPLDKLVPVHVVDYKQPFSFLNKSFPKYLDLFQKSFCIISSLRDISKQCAEEINRHNFDVLLSANCRYQAVSPIARFVKIPSVLYSQEPYRRFYEENVFSAKPVFRKGIRSQEEKTNARNFSKILVNSKYSKKRIDEIYGVESEVCYLGVDTKFFHNATDLRENFFIGVGAFQAHKGIDFAIECISRLPEPRPPLVWVGNLISNDYLDYLRGLAKSLNVDFQPRIMVSDPDLVSLLARARLLLYTSHNEPFGLAPLEAGACETPVVAVAEGGVCETVQNDINGFLVERNPESAAKRIQQLLADKMLAYQMGKNARKLVEKNWTFHQSVNRLEKILAEAKSL